MFIGFNLGVTAVGGGASVIVSSTLVDGAAASPVALTLAFPDGVTPASVATQPSRGALSVAAGVVSYDPDGEFSTDLATAISRLAGAIVGDDGRTYAISWWVFGAATVSLLWRAEDMPAAETTLSAGQAVNFYAGEAPATSLIVGTFDTALSPWVQKTGAGATWVAGEIQVVGQSNRIARAVSGLTIGVSYTIAFDIREIAETPVVNARAGAIFHSGAGDLVSSGTLFTGSTRVTFTFTANATSGEIAIGTFSGANNDGKTFALDNATLINPLATTPILVPFTVATGTTVSFPTSPSGERLVLFPLAMGQIVHADNAGGARVGLLATGPGEISAVRWQGGTPIASDAADISGSASAFFKAAFVTNAADALGRLQDAAATNFDLSLDLSAVSGDVASFVIGGSLTREPETAIPLKGVGIEGITARVADDGAVTLAISTTNPARIILAERLDVDDLAGLLTDAPAASTTPVIDADGLATALAGAAVGAETTVVLDGLASAGVAPLTWAADIGSITSSGSTTLAWTPTTDGLRDVTLGVTDARGVETTVTLPVFVNEAVYTVASLGDLTLTQGAAMTPYDVSVAFAGTAPITYALAPSSGALPAGLSLSTAGLLTGTPTETVTARSIVIRATGFGGATADAGFSLTVAVMSGAATTPAEVYSQSITAGVGGTIDITSGVLGASAYTGAEVLMIVDLTTADTAFPATVATIIPNTATRETSGGSIIVADAHFTDMVHPWTGEALQDYFGGPAVADALAYGPAWDYGMTAPITKALSIRGDTRAQWTPLSGGLVNSQAKYNAAQYMGFKATGADGLTGDFACLVFLLNDATSATEWRYLTFRSAAGGPSWAWPEGMITEGWTHALQMLMLRLAPLPTGTIENDDPALWPAPPARLERSTLSALDWHQRFDLGPPATPGNDQGLEAYLETIVDDAAFDAETGGGSVLNIKLAPGTYGANFNASRRYYEFRDTVSNNLAALTGDRKIRLIGYGLGQTVFAGVKMLEPASGSIALDRLEMCWCVIAQYSVANILSDELNGVVMLESKTAMSFRGCLIDSVDASHYSGIRLRAASGRGARLRLLDSIVLGGTEGLVFQDLALPENAMRADVARTMIACSADVIYANGANRFRLNKVALVSGATGYTQSTATFSEISYTGPANSLVHPDKVQVQVRSSTIETVNTATCAFAFMGVTGQGPNGPMNRAGVGQVLTNNANFLNCTFSDCIWTDTMGSGQELGGSWPDDRSASAFYTLDTVEINRVHMAPMYHQNGGTVALPSNSVATVPVSDINESGVAYNSAWGSGRITVSSVAGARKTEQASNGGWMVSFEGRPDMRTGDASILPDVATVYASPVTFTGTKAGGYVADWTGTTFYGTGLQGLIAPADYVALPAYATRNSADLLQSDPSVYYTPPVDDAELRVALGWSSETLDGETATIRAPWVKYTPTVFPSLHEPIDATALSDSPYGWWNIGFDGGSGTLLEELAADGSGYRFTRDAGTGRVKWEMWNAADEVIGRYETMRPCDEHLLFQTELKLRLESFEPHRTYWWAGYAWRNRSGNPVRYIFDFAASEPSAPTLAAGERAVWFNTTAKTLRIWSGSAWVKPQGQEHVFLCGCMASWTNVSVFEGVSGAVSQPSSAPRTNRLSAIGNLVTGPRSVWVGEYIEATDTIDIGGGTQATGDLCFRWRPLDGWLTFKWSGSAWVGGLAAPAPGYMLCPFGTAAYFNHGPLFEGHEYMPEWLNPIDLDTRTLDMQRGTIYIGRRSDGTDAYTGGSIRYVEARFNDLRADYASLGGQGQHGREAADLRHMLLARGRPDNETTGARGTLGAADVWVTEATGTFIPTVENVFSRYATFTDEVTDPSTSTVVDADPAAWSGAGLLRPWYLQGGGRSQTTTGGWWNIGNGASNSLMNYDNFTGRSVFTVPSGATRWWLVADVRTGTIGTAAASVVMQLRDLSGDNLVVSLNLTTGALTRTSGTSTLFAASALPGGGWRFGIGIDKISATTRLLGYVGNVSTGQTFDLLQWMLATDPGATPPAIVAGPNP